MPDIAKLFNLKYWEEKYKEIHPKNLHVIVIPFNSSNLETKEQIILWNLFYEVHKLDTMDEVLLSKPGKSFLLDNTIEEIKEKAPKLVIIEDSDILLFYKQYLDEIYVNLKIATEKIENKCFCYYGYKSYNTDTYFALTYI